MTLGFLAALLLALPVRAAEPPPLETLGLYIWRDTPTLHDFWRDCGYNRLQFCDTNWHVTPDQHPDLYKTIAAEIAGVQAKGFKTDVILFSNIVQWKGPGPTGNDVGDRFNPRDKAALADRLNYIRASVRALKGSDGFTFFAGDPGGVPPEIGTAKVDDWLAMARQVQQIVREEAPAAEFNINTWAITQWKDWGIGAWDLRFWHNDNLLTADMLAAPNFVGPDCGIQFPMHNYYRSLALAAYAAKGETPEVYPLQKDIDVLRERGTKRIWGWPYFLVDEADDGYLGSLWLTRGQAQAETRYLHKLVSQSRELGLNGLIANFSYSGYPAETLNTYAFARFALDPSATPESVLRQFAGFIAAPDSVERLTTILRFIENNSSWQASLPAKDRLPNFDTGALQSAWAALRWLDQVTPNAQPAIHLPEPPPVYLGRLRDRLQVIAAAEKIPESSQPIEDGGERFAMSGGNWAGDATMTGGADEGSAPAADRAAIAVGSANAAGVFPMRVELPLEVQRDYPSAKLRLTYLTDNMQTTGGCVYLNDQRLAVINAYQDGAAALKTQEVTLDAQASPTLKLDAGVHVLRVAIEQPTPDGAYLATFKLDSVEILP